MLAALMLGLLGVTCALLVWALFSQKRRHTAAVANWRASQTTTKHLVDELNAPNLTSEQAETQVKADLRRIQSTGDATDKVFAGSVFGATRIIEKHEHWKHALWNAETVDEMRRHVEGYWRASIFDDSSLAAAETAKLLAAMTGAHREGDRGRFLLDLKTAHDHLENNDIGIARSIANGWIESHFDGFQDDQLLAAVVIAAILLSFHDNAAAQPGEIESFAVALRQLTGQLLEIFGDSTKRRKPTSQLLDIFRDGRKQRQVAVWRAIVDCWDQLALADRNRYLTVGNQMVTHPGVA